MLSLIGASPISLHQKSDFEHGLRRLKTHKSMLKFICSVQNISVESVCTRSDCEMVVARGKVKQVKVNPFRCANTERYNC